MGKKKHATDGLNKSSSKIQINNNANYLLNARIHKIKIKYTKKL